MVNYYDELPEGYKEEKTVDINNSKTSIFITVLSLFLLVITIVPIIIIGGGISNFRAYGFNSFLLLVLVIAYIFVHELLHGAVYKYLTHKKLKFGFNLLYAYCGVPNIYTSRKTALKATSAPFIIISLVVVPVLFYFSVYQNYILFFTLGLFFSVHVSGCVGDLYIMYLLLFKYKDSRTLMNDTGPKMTIYIPE